LVGAGWLVAVISALWEPEMGKKFISKNKLGMAAHTCNLNCAEGIGKSIAFWGRPRKKAGDNIWKITKENELEAWFKW
jgi:hypothetical protein